MLTIIAIVAHSILFVNMNCIFAGDFSRAKMRSDRGLIAL